MHDLDLVSLLLIAMINPYFIFLNSQFLIILLYIVYTVIMFLGHICEQHNNPADFFLDVISANESSVTEGTFNMLATTC